MSKNGRTEAGPFDTVRGWAVWPVGDEAEDCLTCRVCGCTEYECCPIQGGCSWVDLDEGGDNGGQLCSLCDGHPTSC